MNPFGYMSALPLLRNVLHRHYTYETEVFNLPEELHMNGRKTAAVASRKTKA